MASIHYVFVKRLLINFFTYFGAGLGLIMLVRASGAWGPLSAVLLVSTVIFVVSIVHHGARDLGFTSKFSFFLLSATSLPILLFPVFQYSKYIDIVYGNINVSIFLSMMTYALAALLTYLGFVSYLEARGKVSVKSLLVWYGVTAVAGYLSLLILVVCYSTFEVDQHVLFETWKWMSSAIYLGVSALLLSRWVVHKERK